MYSSQRLTAIHGTVNVSFSVLCDESSQHVAATNGGRGWSDLRAKPRGFLRRLSPAPAPRHLETGFDAALSHSAVEDVVDHRNEMWHNGVLTGRSEFQRKRNRVH